MQEHYGTESYASTYRPDKSIYQDDTRMFHRSGFVYDCVERVRHAQCVDGRLEMVLELVSKRTARMSIAGVDSHTLRLKMHAGDMHFDETSLMVPRLPSSPPRGRLRTCSNELRFTIGGRRVVIGRKPFSLRIEEKSGTTLMELETERIAGTFVAPPLGIRGGAGNDEPFVSWKLGVDERYFGLGEKFGKVERTSTRATIWASDTCGSNTCDLSYKSVPVLFSTGGWGMMLHSSYRSFWEIGTFSYTAGSMLTEDPKLDLFLFFGASLKELIEHYTGLTGRPSMPPKWALGVWMSRCQYENRAQVDEVIGRLRAERIPCDVVHLDPLWMKTHYYYKIGVDACDFVRNDKGFPDLPGLFDEYRGRGFSTCLWINPYIPEGTPTYREAEAHGYLLRSEHGGLARLEHGNPVGMVDFSNPAAVEWWKDYLRELARDGAAVFKPDYGDRVPEGALFCNGRRGKEMHNLYLYLFTKAPYDVIEEVRREGIVWRRAGYIGSQRFPGTWAGDTQVSWKGMRGCFRGGLSAGLTGEAFWSHDIGGFTGPPPSEELYCRWAQFGLLSPLSRFHGTTPREPWHYGETAMKVVRHYARLRYSLIPYLLFCAEQSCETGVPIMRHMALEFPDEPNVETIDDQYMLGESLLVAPVVGEGKRSRHVYLPRGAWYAFDKPRLCMDGPGFFEVKAPLERMPLFVREGAIIPRYIHHPQHLKGALANRIGVDLYPGARRSSVSYTDDEIRFSMNAGTHRGVVRFTMGRAPVTVMIKAMGLPGARVSSPKQTLSPRHTSSAAVVSVDARDGLSLTFGT